MSQYHGSFFKNALIIFMKIRLFLIILVCIFFTTQIFAQDRQTQMQQNREQQYHKVPVRPQPQSHPREQQQNRNPATPQPHSLPQRNQQHHRVLNRPQPNRAPHIINPHVIGRPHGDANHENLIRKPERH
jgi:hypothetical protein